MGLMCSVVLLFGLLVGLLVSIVSKNLMMVMKYFCFGSILSFSASVSLVTFPSGVSSVFDLGELGWMMSHFTLVMDYYSYSFFMISFLVTWSILSFANWYMSGEVKLMKFLIFLVLFLFFMYCLTSCGNLLFILLGWEGVGVMSFLLISWWGGRSEASTFSLQAVIYNRVSDFSIYLGLFLILISGSVMALDFGGVYGGIISLLFLFGVVAKSSQFLFHPWLPNAMEGPTPVSSLLHSSTMVVAGVFLLIRLGDNFSFFVLQIVFLISALTMLYGSMCAMGQSDMKKIVAFSTTSQLGFMMSTLSMGLGILAFIHLCLHAFFKSLVFLSSSYFIHSEGDNQDFRIMSVSVVSSKVSGICLVLGSLSLSGFPFLAGFYSKDLILENLMGSVLNRMSVVILFVSCVLTVGYSFRLIVGGLKGLVSISILSKKVGVEGVGDSVGWNLTRSLLFVIVGGMFVWGQFFFVEEEYVFGSGFFSVFILSMGALLSVISVMSVGLFSAYWLLFYNPLIHQFILKAVRFVLENLLSFEFYMIESMMYGRMSLLSKVGLLYKKGYNFKGYMMPLVLFSFLMSVFFLFLSV